MRSDTIKRGAERAPHRSLLRATGVKEKKKKKPFIAIANSYIDIIPGHVHLQKFGALIKEAEELAEADDLPFVVSPRKQRSVAVVCLERRELGQD